jgi:hypothetical protein
MAAGQSGTLRRAGSFLALLAFEVGAVVLLAQLGRVPALRIPWHSLMPWLLNSPVEDVLAAILRMIALLIAWWLLCSNLLYLFASLTRIPSTVRAVRWVTLPVVRSITDHAVALALATSIVGSGAGASIAAAPPAVAAAPYRSGTMSSGQGDATPARVVGYSPQPAGQTSTTGYVPKPADNVQAEQQGSSSSSTPPSSGSTSRSSSTSTTAPTTTTTPTPSTTAPTSTTGYVPPHLAGPPASTTASSGSTSASSTSTTAPTSTTGYVPPHLAGPPASNRAKPRATKPKSQASPGGGGSQSSSEATHKEPDAPIDRSVQEGDNLWVMSRKRLAEVKGLDASDLSDHEIAAYWLRVIAANPHLPSGDPDLIFPGDIIHLPRVGSS